MKTPTLSGDEYHRRTDRRLCPACEATPAGCECHKWMSGRWCCSTCTGSHDDQGGAA